MTSAAPVTPPEPARRSGERRDAMLVDLAIVPLAPQERRSAAVAVCAATLRHGGTASEARELLDLLGLLGDPAVRKSA